MFYRTSKSGFLRTERPVTALHKTIAMPKALKKAALGRSRFAMAAVLGLAASAALAQEGARAGITANAICPGYIATEMVMAVPEKVRESIIGQIPTGRLGEPEEIARCVTFLASEDAGFINGSTISANGGQFFV